MKPEKILVVPTARVWDVIPYVEKGLIVDGVDRLTGAISRDGTFMERSMAEDDSSCKQIIPYAIVRHIDSIFLLHRKQTQSEPRLHDKFSIGVGGHINPVEIPIGSDWVHEGLTREINEELDIEPGYFPHLVGVINDDTTEVGKVHLGVLFEIFSASLNVKVRETHKMEGDWTSPEGLAGYYGQLETWSQIVYDSHLCVPMLRALRSGTVA
jgi:predicted NUDIX family phosphoesterase